MPPPPGTPPPAPAPVRLIVAAGPTAPSAEVLLGEALAEARGGAAVSVLFSEAGLDFLRGDWPKALEEAGVPTSLCSRSARGRRLDPAALPPAVVWSSLTNFLAPAGPDVRLWTVFT